MTHDHGRRFDWGRTSVDYARHRPGPPDSFYERLWALGIGHPGQRILDLGTGTGVLARRFALQGSRVTGIDIAVPQIEAARRLAVADGLDVSFRVAPAEETEAPNSSFDVATANQCFLYFDPQRTLAELRRVLVPGGRLMVSHFSFLPRLDPIARAAEELVLRFNPVWSGADWDGAVAPVPGWAKRPDLRLVGFFVYDEAIPFTRETWRGRMRACRGIGAGLPDEQVGAFDRAHAELLESIAPAEFTVLHRLDARVFELT